MTYAQRIARNKFVWGAAAEVATRLGLVWTFATMAAVEQDPAFQAAVAAYDAENRDN